MLLQFVSYKRRSRRILDRILDFILTMKIDAVCIVDKNVPINAKICPKVRSEEIVTQ